MTRKRSRPTRSVKDMLNSPEALKRHEDRQRRQEEARVAEAASSQRAAERREPVFVKMQSLLDSGFHGSFRNLVMAADSDFGTKLDRKGTKSQVGFGYLFRAWQVDNGKATPTRGRQSSVTSVSSAKSYAAGRVARKNTGYVASKIRSHTARKNSGSPQDLSSYPVPLDENGEGSVDVNLGPYNKSQLLEALRVPPARRHLWAEEIAELDAHGWLETTDYLSELRGYQILRRRDGSYWVLGIAETG